MSTLQVVIIGGGLSGLYAAALLQERGVRDYVLIEARDTFGGRIMSASDVPDNMSTDGKPRSISGRFDLGATWFWPSMHPGVQQLINDLGLDAFPQHDIGDMLIERFAASDPSRVDGYLSAPPAFRLKGGMMTLTEALRNRLPAKALVSGQQVVQALNQGENIEVQAMCSRGQAMSYHATHVLLAVPPRLVINKIGFDPALPDVLCRQWQACGTWMAPHAKYLAVFDTPFWYEQGLSGEVRSAIGPMAEIHDASEPEGVAALFGFLGIPAASRRQILEATLRAHCRAQLVRLFGEQAAQPRAEFLKDWAVDPYTAVAADQASGSHGMAALPITPTEHPWKNRLIGIASEWSPNFPGYVAGALEAAHQAVDALLAPDVLKPAPY